MGAFVIPEDIESLDNDALAEAVDGAFSAGRALAAIPDEEISDEQATRLGALYEFHSNASAVLGARNAAATERAERLSASRSAFTAEPEEAVEEEVGEAEEAEEDAVVVETVPAEVVEEEEEATSPPAVDTASARRSFASRAARKTPDSQKKAPVMADVPRASLTAAADVPSFSAGQKFSNLTEAAKAIGVSLNNLPKGAPKGTHTRNGAVVITLPENKFNQNQYRGRDEEMLLAAASESRLEGGSLVAAGGWGAPSETLMDFCGGETTEGLISVPEVTITRGGVQYTKGPSFDDVMAATEGFWDMTEAVAEAGVEEKTSLRPELPDFVEKRLDAVGVMIEAGLLLRKGWPEVIERYTELALVAHQYKLHAKTIAQIAAYTGAPINVPNGFGNALDVLHILDVVAYGERQRNALSEGQTLEVVLPRWVKGVIKADLSNRTGVDFLNVTDAQINGWFSARGLRVQWLAYWQNVDVATAGISTKYPANADAFMYPAGTFVRGTSDVITLDTVYDSVNLKKNDYVHLFTEQGTVVTNPCNTGRAIRIPLVANGTTGAADYSGNLFVAP
jgi:hypothetical protein